MSVAHAHEATWDEQDADPAPDGSVGPSHAHGSTLRPTSDHPSPAPVVTSFRKTGRPRLLDLFCGAGGAGMGYHRAGFDVVGVDIEPQPHYPFEFHQADALTFPLEGFDAIHASPPCQAYSSATRDPGKHPDLYAPTRDRLVRSGLPYVIENVIGAPYSHGVVLCGSMFGLEADGEWLQRHRNFEASWMLMSPGCSHRKDQRAVTVTGKSFIREVRTFGRHSRQGPFELAERLMGIDWMDRHSLPLAIPPAYTEWIGAQLLRAIEAERAA